MPADAFTDPEAVVTDFHFGYIAVREGPREMLTAAQQHAIDQFAKSLLALSDDALIDT